MIKLFLYLCSILSILKMLHMWPKYIYRVIVDAKLASEPIAHNLDSFFGWGSDRDWFPIEFHREKTVDFRNFISVETIDTAYVYSPN